MAFGSSSLHRANAEHCSPHCYFTPVLTVSITNITITITTITIVIIIIHNHPDLSCLYGGISEIFNRATVSIVTGTSVSNGVLGVIIIIIIIIVFSCPIVRS